MKLSRSQFYGLATILILPNLALVMLLKVAGSIPLVIGIYSGLAVLQLLTFFQIKIDKDRAKAGEWRIPESRLHSLELLGGWPSSFLAQRCYRHKISKKSYQFIFWLVVLLHQVIAGDYLLDGPLSEYLAKALP